MIKRILISFSLLLSLAGFSASSFAWTCSVEGQFTGSSPAVNAALAIGGWSGSSTYNSIDSNNCGGTIAVTCGSGRKAYVTTKSGSSNRFHFCFPSSGSSCPAGMIDNGTGKCMPACTVPGKTNLLASDPLCVESNPCENKPSSSTSQYKTDVIGGSYCDNGCTATLMLTISSSGSSCYTYYDDPLTEYCPASLVYSGAQCTGQSEPSAPAAVPPEQLPTVEPPQCPTGYTYDPSTIRCVQPATSGTPSSEGSPGTGPTPTQYSCPVGYAMQADGSCTGTSDKTTPGGAVSCPVGFYATPDGLCSSNQQNGLPGTVSGAIGSGGGSGTPSPVGGLPGTGTSGGAGSCGSPGQPECELGALHPTDPNDIIPKISHFLSSVVQVSVPSPAAQCPAAKELPHGLVWKWDTICAFAEFLRPLILAFAWLSAGFIVLGGRQH